jgi:1-deoxy-D-xylulose-5-phosphate synthase
MAVACDLKDEDRQIVAIIGNGAMSASMAYEAMTPRAPTKPA